MPQRNYLHNIGPLKLPTFDSSSMRRKGDAAAAMAGLHLRYALALGLCLIVATPSHSGNPPLTGPTVPSAPDKDDPPLVRPGHFAVREEFEAARRAGTRAALELFIARHPGDPLADDARRLLSTLPR